MMLFAKMKKKIREKF